MLVFYQTAILLAQSSMCSPFLFSSLFRQEDSSSSGSVTLILCREEIFPFSLPPFLSPSLRLLYSCFISLPPSLSDFSSFSLSASFSFSLLLTFFHFVPLSLDSFLCRSLTHTHTHAYMHTRTATLSFNYVVQFRKCKHMRVPNNLQKEDCPQPASFRHSTNTSISFHVCDATSLALPGMLQVCRQAQSRYRTRSPSHL